LLLLDHIGRQFGLLTIVGPTGGYTSRGSPIYRCLCSCGQEKEYSLARLEKNNTKSCRCRIRTKEYQAWKEAKSRCENPRHKSFNNYGGRGIRMSTRWSESFEAFFEDMGVCPDALTLERLDVNGNYSRRNCAWRSCADQAHNRRNNKLTVQKAAQIRKIGRSQTYAVTAKQFNVHPSVISRVLNGARWKEV
jgi:hypothetical protein